MKILLALTAALAAMSSAPGPIQAQRGADVEDSAPPLPPCTAANARQANIADVAGGALMTGVCVRVQGIVSGMQLLADERARYRLEARYNDPSSTGAIVGLMFATHAGDDTPKQAQIVGRIVDCDRINADNGPRHHGQGDVVAIMDDSFCGRYRGRAIEVVSIDDAQPVTLTRLTRAQAGPDLGNLSPLPDGAVRQRIARTIAQLATAVSARDGAAIRRLHTDPRTGAVAGDVEEVEALYATLPSGSPVTTQIFGWREPRWVDAGWQAEQAAAHTAEAIACLSAVPDAAARWPIDSKDTDNSVGRPYVCTRATVVGSGADAQVLLSTTRASSGLPEPAA